MEKATPSTEQDLQEYSIKLVNGNASYGGAIFGNGDYITIDNCIIMNNTAEEYGGAIYNDEGKITITNTEFTQNTAKYGGAIYNGTAMNSTFINNSAQNGQAIHGGSAIFCLFENNTCYNTSFYPIISVSNLTAYYNSGEKLDFNLTYHDQIFNGVNTTIEIYQNDVLIDTYYCLSGDGWVVNLGIGEYEAVLSLDKYPAVKPANASICIEDPIKVIAPDLVKYYNSSERFVVYVLLESKAIANKTVSISINGLNYTRTTDNTGMASISLNLQSGNYSALVNVDNMTVKSSVTIKTTVNSTDIVKVFRNGTQYYATFLDSEGNYLKNGTNVLFNINGVLYDRKVSGDKGLARLNINLEQGKYIITAMNPVTGENVSNNITVLSRLVENADLIKYYRNSTQYTVKVIGDDGKAVGAGKTAKFNINGVFYERQTNESGIAKLNINLQPGDYIITAEYEGCFVANNITVLPVLSAKDLTKKYGTPNQFVATLVDGQGKPYAGQNITFNINGVFYDRTTDANGQAKLNIRLMPGEYIITSSYNGYNIANKITVQSWD